MMVKETNVKIPEEAPAAPPENQFNLDGILCELGSFGKYQLLLLLLLAFRDAFLAMCNFNYVFTAAEVNFRCVVPECEYDDSRFNVSWTSFAIPNDTKMCFRQAPSIGSLNHTSHDEFPWEQDRCTPASFDLNNTIPCHKVIYEDYNSIVAEFDLGCQPWKRTLIGTVHNLGLIFSFVISGFISDSSGDRLAPAARGLLLHVGHPRQLWQRVFRSDRVEDPLLAVDDARHIRAPTYCCLLHLPHGRGRAVAARAQQEGRGSPRAEQSGESEQHNALEQSEGDVDEDYGGEE